MRPSNGQSLPPPDRFTQAGQGSARPGRRPGGRAIPVAFPTLSRLEELPHRFHFIVAEVQALSTAETKARWRKVFLIEMVAKQVMLHTDHASNLAEVPQPYILPHFSVTRSRYIGTHAHASKSNTRMGFAKIGRDCESYLSAMFNMFIG